MRWRIPGPGCQMLCRRGLRSMRKGDHCDPYNKRIVSICIAHSRDGNEVILSWASRRRVGGGDRNGGRPTTVCPAAGLGNRLQVNRRSRESATYRPRSWSSLLMRLRAIVMCVVESACEIQAVGDGRRYVPSEVDGERKKEKRNQARELECTSPVSGSLGRQASGWSLEGNKHGASTGTSTTIAD